VGLYITAAYRLIKGTLKAGGLANAGWRQEALIDDALAERDHSHSADVETAE
jgi:hypothetical protein